MLARPSQETQQDDDDDLGARLKICTNGQIAGDSFSKSQSTRMETT
jgi:hypothetical protein